VGVQGSGEVITLRKETSEHLLNAAPDRQSALTMSWVGQPLKFDFPLIH
jgi:hypothetical protein